MGHASMENRHGLAVAGMVTQADGTAERRASKFIASALAIRRHWMLSARRAQRLCSTFASSLGSELAS
jgi:hypothetical protein